ncbi:MAG: amino acid adenylation domain-containing protein [Nitrosomonas sp.]
MNSINSSRPDSDLVAVLSYQAQLNPDGLAYIFLSDGENQEQSINYGQLEAQAKAIAAELQKLGMQGERALLLYPAGLDYITAFFGCLYAGVIAVPAYPPSRHHLHRLKAIIHDATPSVVLTTEELRERLHKNHDKTWEYDGLTWLATNALADSNCDAWISYKVETENLAFLQYTSGSTGNPKGVMVSHRNLMANQRIIQQAFAHTPDTVVVGWLPLYHDMGLIGNILQPLYLGATAILMSPLTFLEKPIRWLQAISKYRATTSGGPNFAYELCIRKLTIEQIRGLDLSCWTLAFNGSEPARSSTLRKFSEIFSECGFRQEAFFPCYGLAESTLFVAGRKQASHSELERVLTPKNDISADAKNSHAPVSCGHAWGEHEICIVNPETGIPCADGEEGEIWVAGPSVAQGYWNRPEDSGEVFRASLVSDFSRLSLSDEKNDNSEHIYSDPVKKYFLRTGDLGIIDQDDLFVTGRIKDLIILRGRNYYPHDLEQSLDDNVSGLRSQCCAVFSIEQEGEECLMVVAEIKRRKVREQEAQQIFSDMRCVLTEVCDAPVGELILVPPGSILKTSSGKIQRQATKRAYMMRQLNILARSGAGDVSSSLPSTNTDADDDIGDLLSDAMRKLPNNQRLQLITRLLLSKLAKLLVVPKNSLSPDTMIRSMGLDSLRVVELKHAVDSALGSETPLALFLSDQSVSELATILTNDTYFTFTPPATATFFAQDNSGLTCAQKAIWMVHQLEPQSIAYNLHLTFRLQGNFDIEILRRALNTLLERHPQLRTIYRMHGDSLQQILIPQTDLPNYFTAIDAYDWTASKIQADLTQRVREPFNLSSGPMLRVTSYQQSKHDHILLFCAHHIAVDLWTGLILLDDLKQILLSLTLGKTPSLPKSAADYQDFVTWQKSYLTSQSSKNDLDYWHQQLCGILPILALPVDFSRTQVMQYHGASHSVQLDQDLTKKIRLLGQKHGASLFMTLLAIYKVLLHRYTHQDDIIVGTASNGRPQARFKYTAGNFVNPIALRSKPNSKLPFSTYLEQVRDMVLGALSHSNYPFSLLVEHLQPERNAEYWPIYQTWFMLQQGRTEIDDKLSHLALGEEGESLNWGNWTISSKAIDEQVENFDLRLMAAENLGGLLLSFKYRRDLFETETIARMAEHFQRLLKQVIARPELCLAELSLLTETEKRQFIEWNSKSTLMPLTDNDCLHQLFEAQVKRTPMQTAVVCEGEKLTYAELNTSANQLANYLRAQGIGPETIVGLCVKRSLDMMIGILGILKAGGAYVPIDPDLPAERMVSLLSDSKAALLITQQTLIKTLPVQNLRTLCLDTNHDYLVGQSKTDLHNLSNASQLAYIIYTSGSTGKPKGVAITHGNVVRSTQARFHTYQDRIEGFLLLSSYTFDSSIAGIFWTLCQGGCVTLPLDGDEKDPRILGKILSNGGITHFLCLPSLYSVLLDNIAQSCFDALKVVIVAGEACPSDMVARHYQKVPHVSLFNEYGPTEGTVWSSFFRTQAEDARRTIPIGRPVDHVQIYLLDHHLNQVPVGVTGELYIGGTGIARGYLNSPDLTAERFIPHFLCEQDHNEVDGLASGEKSSGNRLYKTGDLARYRSDGSIEFLGRVDHQVKIRGYRIELGEIEAKLRQYPGIRESIVLARKDRTGSLQLVAYLIVDTLQQLSVLPTNDELMPIGSSVNSLSIEKHPRFIDAEINQCFSNQHLRTFLKRDLPDFMLPSAFVFLEAWPLLPNGKVNRAGLPAPEEENSQFNQECIEPSNTVESTLMRIWREVLNLDKPFGVYDNFFDLGGHSLLAIQVMVQIQEEFNIELPVVNIFEASTIAELAELVTQQQMVDANNSLLESLLDELEQLPDEEVEFSHQEVIGVRNIL